MSSLGNQWRVIRHYLSLNNIHAEVEKLVQKVKPATPEQWDNLINKIEKAISVRITRTKYLNAEKSQDVGIVKASAVQETNIETKSNQQSKDVNQDSTHGVVSDVKELSVEGLWQGLKLKKDNHLGKISEPNWKLNKNALSKTSIHSRTAYVVRAIVSAETPACVLRRTEKLIEHLHEYPEARDYAIKEGAVRALLRVQDSARDDEPLSTDISGAANEALALVGYTGPPRWAGANVLALDGGGIRGIIALEVLRHLEQRTGRKLHELFDYVIGVSTGAIIAAAVSGPHSSLEEARRLYVTLARDMFGGTTRLGGASRLVWTHSYYDTALWEKLLRDHLREDTLSSCNRRHMPKMAVVSCVVNAGSRLSPFLFRSYEVGFRVRSAFPGTSAARTWHAVRASAAAPTYFEEFRLGALVHQDGGILANNPAALGLHEARLLYGERALRLGTVLSLGTGRAHRPHHPLHHPDHPHHQPPAPTTWRDKFNKILDSATDTEGVHLALSDLLPAGSYFRFNPPLTQDCAMDEIDQRKLDAILEDTAAYIRRNEHKFSEAAARLTRPRPLARRLRDALVRRATLAGLTHGTHGTH